jgi:hypothetical protein
MGPKNNETSRLMKDDVIEKDDVEGIISMLQSSDPENNYMALSILENCNHGQSMPWLLVIYRMINYNKRVMICKNNYSKKLWESLSKVLKLEEPRRIFNSQQCLHILYKCANNDEAIVYIEQDCADRLKEQLIQWGHVFLEDYQITLTRTSNARRQKSDISQGLQGLDA